MKRTLTAAALAAVSIAFFTSCQKKDVNAASTELFQKVILADPAAKQQICGAIKTDLIQLPKEFQEFETKSPRFEKFRVLQRLGYVSITPATVASSFGTQVSGVKVALTEQGTTSFGHEYDQKRCYGEWKAQIVKNFTQPAEIAGVKASQVTTEGQQQYTGWATDPELRKLLYVPTLQENAEKTVILVLRNDGWAVSGVQK